MTTQSTQGEIRPEITPYYIRSTLDKQIQSVSENYRDLTSSLAYLGSVQVWAMHLSNLKCQSIELAATASEFAENLMPGSAKDASDHAPISAQIDELADTVIGLHAFFMMVTDNGEPVTDAELAELQEWAETLIDASECLGVCEGYATGVSCHMATHWPIFVAFDAGNLEPVARAIRVRYPDIKIIIFGDDDFDNPDNPGRRHAESAARAVRGFALFPPIARVA